MLRSPRIVSLLLIAAATGMGVGLTVILLRDGSTASAQEVDVVFDGSVIGQAEAADAVRQVSDEVGFEVRMPADVPASMELVQVEANKPSPPGMAHRFRIAATVWYGPGGVDDIAMRVEQSGEPYQPPAGRALPYELGIAGVEAWTQTTERAVGYWLFTEEHGFLVTFVGENRKLADAQVRPVLASLVTQ